MRTIGIVRARAKIDLQNLAYNIRRLVTLERLAASMKTVESSALFQPKQRKKQGGKTIENRTQPELVPNQASKSNIVRGAL